MTYPLTIQPEAEADLAAAFCWYEEQRSGLGLEFLDCVEEVWKRISSTPELHAATYRGVRQALVRAISIRCVLPVRIQRSGGHCGFPRTSRSQVLAVSCSVRLEISVASSRGISSSTQMRTDAANSMSRCVGLKSPLSKRCRRSPRRNHRPIPAEACIPLTPTDAQGESHTARGSVVPEASIRI